MYLTTVHRSGGEVLLVDIYRANSVNISQFHRQWGASNPIFLECNSEEPKNKFIPVQHTNKYRVLNSLNARFCLSGCSEMNNAYFSLPSLPISTLTKSTDRLCGKHQYKNYIHRVGTVAEDLWTTLVSRFECNRNLSEVCHSYTVCTHHLMGRRVEFSSIPLNYLLCKCTIQHLLSWG